MVVGKDRCLPTERVDQGIITHPQQGVQVKDVHLLTDFEYSCDLPFKTFTVAGSTKGMFAVDDEQSLRDIRRVSKERSSSSYEPGELL